MELEIVVLRHELSVLRRQIGRPSFRPADRLFLTAVSRMRLESGGRRFWSRRRHFCAGTDAWWRTAGPTRDGPAERRSAVTFES